MGKEKTKEKSKEKSDKRYATIIGVGLVLFPIHNAWLVNVTAVNGEATLFLPVFGTVIWILATLFFIRDNWRELDWGDKRVYVPLLVIVGAIALSGITADTLGGKFAPLLMGLALFSLYLVSRKLGKDIFFPLAIGAAIASVGVIVHGLLYPGQVTGGFVFERNYDVVVGFVLLGAAMFIHRWRLYLSALALMAMFFTGSPEAVFVVGVVAVVALLRRDWSKKAVVVFGVLILIAGIWFAVGPGQRLYGYAFQAIQGEPGITIDSEVGQHEEAGGVVASTTLGYRYVRIVQAMTNIKPLGEGYNLTDFGALWMVHNVPLVIVQQLGYPGILAGLAWLWVSIWCLVKTRWKYTWVLVLSASVFDHFIFTQLAPFFWAIVGVSTSCNIKSDLVFRGQR